MRTTHLLLMLGAALLALAAACSGPDATPTAEPDGVLAGAVTIGPLCPVEPCDASQAEVYSGREIVLQAPGASAISMPLDVQGRFGGSVPPGTYAVRLSNCVYLGCDGVFPAEVTIAAGETKTLTLDIDTGIRAPAGGGPLDTLLAQLRALGVSVQLGDAVHQPFFEVSGLVVSVNGVDFQVFVYATAAAAAADASQVSPDGSTIGTTSVFWIGPPHFYRDGAVMVLYVGEDAAVLGLLATAFGTQFAGAAVTSASTGTLDLASLPPELREMAACLQEAFGEETFGQLLAGEYIPTFADLAKLGECDVDPALLTTITSVVGGPSEPIIEGQLVDGTPTQDPGN